MPNTICQNHARYKDFLSAHRQAYARAKSGRKVEIIISFAPIIACLALYQMLSRMPGIAPFPTLQALFALLSVITLFYCDLVLDPIRKLHRRDANLDLEAYDVGVLDLPWNESLAGRARVLSDVSEEVREYDKDTAASHPPELSLSDSWYPPEIESLDLPAARIYCQRQNCVFEIAYRKKYLQFFLWPMLLFTALLVVTQAWVFGATVTSYCLTLIIAAPIFRVILMGILVQTDNLTTMLRLMQKIDEARKVSPEEQNRLARDFQDRLFLSRDTLPLISIGGFKYIKSSYLPRLKAESVQLMQADRA